MITASLAYTILSRDMTKSLDRVANQAQVKKDAQYYADNINKVKNVDDFLGDYKLYSYAMKAYGLDDMIYAKAFMKKVLESDLTNANSFANKLSDTRYKEFAAAFNFNAPPKDIQTDAQEDDLIGLYKQSFADAAQQTATETKYYSAQMDGVKTVQDFVGNSRLLNYALKSVGIDPTYMSKDYVANVLTTDISKLGGNAPDPSDPAYDPTKTYVGDKLYALAQQFNFKPDNGDTQYFRSNIGSVQSVDDLLADPRLRTVALQSVGIDPATADNAFIKMVLTSDPATLGGDAPLNNPNPSLNYVGDKYKELRSYFNFNADGSVNGSAQNSGQTDAVAELYAFRAPAVGGAAQTATQKNNVIEQYNIKTAPQIVDRDGTASDVYYTSPAMSDLNKSYYVSKIGTITNVDQLVNDKRLADYVRSAFGMDPGFTQLKSVLTDPAYARSVDLGDAYKAFNFKSDGTISPTKRAQSYDQLTGMVNAASNVSGYFSNKMVPASGPSTINNVDELLSDKTLTSYIKDAYGLGQDFSNAELKNILTDSAYAATAGHQDIHDAFNFNADGSVNGTIQSAAQLKGINQLAANNASYYQAKLADLSNNGSTAAVDVFLADSKLVSFLRTNLQISDTISDATLRSILTDPTVAAAQGYSDVYQLFNFRQDGTVAQNTLSQSADQVAALNKKADDAAAYYGRTMPSISSVDQLLGDQKLNNYIRYAFSIPTSVSDTDLRSILTDQSGTGPYDKVKAAFNFQADGTVVPGLPAQTTTQMASLNSAANIREQGTLDRMGDINDVDQLLADSSLTDYLKMAYGLAYDTSNAELKSILTDPAYAASVGQADLNAAFNFAADGSLPTSTSPQTGEQTTNTSDNYGARANNQGNDLIDRIVANYKSRMDDANGVKNVNDFMKTNKTADTLLGNDSYPDLYQMALQAYGLTTNDVSRSTMRKLLVSDPYDPKGYVASFKDDRITKMVRAFNFGADGKAAEPMAALSAATMAKYATDYKSHVTMLMKDGPAKDRASKDATKEVDYFGKTIPTVTSLDDFLGDKRLTDLVLKANGLDPKKYDKDTLKKIFTSDPDDKKSYLSTTADARFKEIVASFNFGKDGNLTRAKMGTVQDKQAEANTQQQYVQMTLETQEGEKNDGVRLALYFKRKAGDVTSLYSILGDKALYQVVQTTYSLPAQISSMDVAKQVDLLGRFVKLEDLQDPKKVDKLVKRFAAMYDIKNNTQQSPALQLLTGGTG
ncbi:DUF1217 domain-containing protein [Rhizobium sp. CF142]|uniref:DUF1217 domain-containing protein n=1 Tax=Rhizobium sp. CF142 TaxID=1144314 RepID=UPI00026EF2AB|nr:DUF1217 domain-containing protein [Rhizobium sp. CF142]EJJ28859.1 Protein of unknown function (DUF1217) [Rhizobium sp. CF142]